jgi:hypothetical protein
LHRAGIGVADSGGFGPEKGRRPGGVAACRGDGDAMNVRAVFGGLLLISAAAFPLGADEPISMKVSPAVAFAPANLVVRATIQSDADNRAVEIIAESSDFYRSSEIQLEGDKAARTSTFEFRSLPPGTYEVRATLYGATGKRGVVRQQVNVIASGTADR